MLPLVSLSTADHPYASQLIPLQGTMYRLAINDGTGSLGRLSQPFQIMPGCMFCPLTLMPHISDNNLSASTVCSFGCTLLTNGSTMTSTLSTTMSTSGPSTTSTTSSSSSVRATDPLPLPSGLNVAPLATNGPPAPLVRSGNNAQTPPAPTRRSAIAACLNVVELSCLNLAANCIDTVDYDVSLIYSTILHDPTVTF
jgi:hypothetical protein